LRWAVLLGSPSIVNGTIPCICHNLCAPLTWNPGSAPVYLPRNSLRKGRDLYSKLYFIYLQICICKTSMLIFSLLIAYIYYHFMHLSQPMTSFTDGCWQMGQLYAPSTSSTLIFTKKYI
jgi:hypothetical protein